MGIDKSTQHSKSSVASVEVQDRYTESHDNRSSSQIIEHMLSEVDHSSPSATSPDIDDLAKHRAYLAVSQGPSSSPGYLVN